MKKKSDLKLVLIAIGITAILLALVLGVDFKEEYVAPKERISYSEKTGNYLNNSGTPYLNIY